MNNKSFFIGLDRLARETGADATERQMCEAIAGIAAGAMFEGVTADKSNEARFMNYLAMCEAKAGTPQDVAAVNLIRGRFAMMEAVEGAGKAVDDKAVAAILKILAKDPDNAKLTITTAFKQFKANAAKAAADAKAAEKQKKIDEQNTKDDATIKANTDKTAARNAIKERQAQEASPAIDENKIKQDAVAEITKKFQEKRPELFDEAGNPKDQSTADVIAKQAEAAAAEKIKEAGKQKPVVDKDLAALDQAQLDQNKVGIADRAKSLAAHTRQAIRQNKGIGGKLKGLFKGAKQALLGEGIDQETVNRLGGPEALALCEAAGIKVEPIL